MLQHKQNKFHVILTKIALEYNLVTLKIKPMRSCEVSSLTKKISLDNIKILFSSPISNTKNTKTIEKLTTRFLSTSNPISYPVCTIITTLGPYNFRSRYPSRLVFFRLSTCTRILIQFSFAFDLPSEGTSVDFESSRPTTLSMTYSG